MVLKRIANRRRRILVETSASAEDGTAKTDSQRSAARKGGTTEVRPYTIGAERRHQPKTTDLIPKRPLAYCFLIVSIVFLVVSINLLARYAPNWHASLGHQGVAALRPWGPGTLATWLASALLLTASGVSWQILVLRRHRNDDYEGTYRLWGWLTVGCVFASAACSVDLISTFLSISAYLTSVAVVEPAWLPLAMMLAAAGLLVVRVLFEVRRSMGTAAWTVFAWLALTVGMLLPELPDRSVTEYGLAIDRDVAMGNGLLLAAAGILLATFTYARFVFLRANGFIRETVTISGEVNTAEDLASLRPSRLSRIGAGLGAFSGRILPRRSRVASDSESEAAPESVEEVSTKPARKTRRKAKKQARAATSNEEAATGAKQPAETVSKVASETSTATTTRKSKRKAKTKKASSASKPQTPANESEPAAENSGSTEETPKQVGSDASEKLRRLAEASRAKQASQAQGNPQDVQYDEDRPPSVKLTKAQRRKQRKQQRNMKRAA